MSDKRISRRAGVAGAVIDAAPASHVARTPAHESLRSAGRRPRHARRAMGDREDRGRVFLQLSKEQVDGIIAGAITSNSGYPSGAAVARADFHSDDAGESTQWIFGHLMDDKSFSHSLLIGLEVLTCFPLDGTERGVADVAEQLNMNTSTVHRYMSTLLRVGLLERNPDTRWYRVASAESGSGVER